MKSTKLRQQQKVQKLSPAVQVIIGILWVVDAVLWRGHLIKARLGQNHPPPPIAKTWNMFQRTLHYGQGEGGWNGIFQESLRPPSDAQEHEICFRFLHFLLLLLPSTGSMADKLKGSILPTTWIRERHLSFDAAINPEMLYLHLFLCVGKETIFENICEFDWYWVLWFLPVTIKEYVVKIYMA